MKIYANAFMTYNDIQAAVPERLDTESNVCPYCGDPNAEIYHDEWEFNVDHAWLRLRCCECDCTWGVVYTTTVFEPHDNREEWTAYMRNQCPPTTTT